MKPITLIAVIFLCLIVNGTAGAQTTGQDIESKCKQLVADKPTISFEGGLCAGLVEGVVGDEAMWQASDKDRKQTHVLNFCVPENSTNGQYLKVFVKYLDEHPEELNKTATFLVREAFNKAFPCGQ